MRKLVFYLACWCLFVGGVSVCESKAMGLVPPAVNYMDSVVFCIDSAKIEDNSLVFSLMFHRPNESWKENSTSEQDTLLGNVDFYFWMMDAVFDKTALPRILRHHAGVTPVGKSGNTLLSIEAKYYAQRFLVALRKQPVTLTQTNLPVLWNQPVELCQVKLPLLFPDQNPGFRWDSVATGGQSKIGQPLIKVLQGDVKLNPDKDIRLLDYTRIETACEGGVAKFWAKGHTNGTDPRFSWYFSTDPDGSNPVAIVEDMKTAATPTYITSGSKATPWGPLTYRVSADQEGMEWVDTLYLLNVPISLDSIYVQCKLSDRTLSTQPKTSIWGESQLLVRDSIFGWFAAIDPSMRDDHTSTNIGASDRTDTVMKCPGSGARTAFYFFGPECDDDRNTIGDKMTVNYLTRDNFFNVYPSSVEISSWSKVDGKTAPNGKCLYWASVELDTVSDVISWVSSISTAKGCDNGAAYTKWDTVYIRNVAPDGTVLAALTDTTISSGESFSLDKSYAYTGYELKQPALGSLDLDPANPRYKAPTTSCNDPNGCADTIIYSYEVNVGDGASCTMKVGQKVNIGDIYYLSAKVLLEGGFQYGTGGLMLNIQRIDFPRNGAGQYTSPYSDETVSALPTFDNGMEVVDWIYILLRDENNVGKPLEIVDSTSAFLRQDGAVFGKDGKPYVTFKNLPKDKYHVIIQHRNHIGVMSKNSIELKNTGMAAQSVTMVDFTQDNNCYKDSGISTPVMATLSDGRKALFVGDVNADGMVSRGDLNEMTFNMPSVGYNVIDVNFDGLGDSIDYLLIEGNLDILRHY